MTTPLRPSTAAGSGSLTPDHDDPSGAKNRRHQPRGRESALAAVLQWCSQVQLLVGLVAGLFAGTWSTYYQISAIRRLVEPMAKKSCAEWPVAEQRQYAMPCRALYEAQGVALTPPAHPPDELWRIPSGLVVLP